MSPLNKLYQSTLQESSTGALRRYLQPCEWIGQIVLGTLHTRIRKEMQQVVQQRLRTRCVGSILGLDLRYDEDPGNAALE